MSRNDKLTYITYLIIAAYIPSEGVYFSYYILTHLVYFTTSHTTQYYAIYF